MPPMSYLKRKWEKAREGAFRQGNAALSGERKAAVTLDPALPSENEDEADIDIIAIHGLDTKSPDTWIWKKSPDDLVEEGVNWLKDPHMLPARFPKARIFTCDWP